MTAKRDVYPFTCGDPVSRTLIDVASDRLQQIHGPIPAGTVELGQRHGLIPMLSDLTDDAMVRAVATRETARSTILQKHLSELLGRLHHATIRTAVLKGPAIGARYRNPSHRAFSDLDLLVPESQVAVALDLLAAYPPTLSIPEKRPKADKRDILLRDDSGVVFNVDIHWDLFSYNQLRGSAEGATEKAWADAREVESALGRHWDIQDPYRVAFLGAHAVLDHRFRLILFRDFLELCRGEVDWEAVGGLATRWGLRSTTYLALWLSQSALDAAVPEDFLSALRPKSLPVAYLERALPRTDLVRFDGHRPHPINLASVLLNDSHVGRFSLLLRAPAAVPRWWRRVTEEEARYPGSPRVLILVSTDRRRGAEVFTERLCQGLMSLGWVVEAVALRASGEGPRADLEPLVSWHESSGGRFDLSIARRLRARVRSYRPDLVVANGGATLRYAIADNLSRRYRLVYIGIGEPQYWLRSRLSRWLNRLMLHRVDEVIAVSDVTRRQLLALEPSLDDRMFTVHTGVPEDLFDIPMAPPEGPLRVLMIGSLTPEKNPHQALRVVAEVPDALLRFVGDGPLKSDLAREAERIGMRDRVEFAGSVTDVTPHLRWAHVLILTSRSEGLPGAVLEAGGAAIPTVAVDVGGVREAVDDGVGGFVTGPGDQEMIEALRIMDSDRERLAQMGKAAREHVMSHFRMDHVIRRYADVLTRVTR